ncbi:MAG TPA: exo-beta-N-acetylmuramidase NamZ domain-containing protein, partial [Candidatus Limnocylindria bacterium]|nr:exo-beta-N-acetylmuramidase NamZ domain-containing protein [Candidatus Limnocylindria bacterium]
ELAKMFNAENKIGANLHVFTMMNWKRNATYDQTGLKWIPPSPNLRTLNAAFLYPGIEILQSAGVSVGRGTETPFELLGAPWIQAAELAAELNRRAVPGGKFQTTLFTPDDGLYKSQYCQGVSITITDRAGLNSMRVGLEIASALHRLYPQQFHLEKIIELLGSRATLARLERGDDPARIIAGWSDDLGKFRTVRAKYLLYH